MIYLDYAATSWPKAPGVAAAMAAALDEATNPGRGGHRLSLAAAGLVFGAREALAELVGVADPARVVFTSGCTEALNVAILGLLRPGAHVVTTSLEHNAVARPLRHVEETRGVRVTVVPCDSGGVVPPAALLAAREPETALVVMNHGSNVCGAVQDVAAVKRLLPDVPLLVDASQTAGVLPLDVDGWGLDLVAVSGHKGLRGPQGTGALVLGPRAPLPAPLVHGGTGSRSEQDVQPPFLPDRLEAGTPNLPGIAGLAAALTHLRVVGRAAVEAEERALGAAFRDGLFAQPHVRAVGLAPGDAARLATFSVVVEGLDPGRAALRLEREHDVLVRAGLHCAPWAHRALGTYPTGTVRISFGPGTPPDAPQAALAALRALAPGDAA